MPYSRVANNLQNGPVTVVLHVRLAITSCTDNKANAQRTLFVQRDNFEAYGKDMSTPSQKT